MPLGLEGFTLACGCRCVAVFLGGRSDIWDMRRNSLVLLYYYWEYWIHSARHPATVAQYMQAELRREAA